MSLNRQSREEAEFKAFLRSKRGYEKKMEDIAWTYEQFYPMLEAYQAGRISVKRGMTPFSIEQPRDEEAAA